MISVGLIGAGKITSGFDYPGSTNILTHANAISNLDEFTISGFYDIDYEAARKASNKWDTKCYKKLEELVIDSDVLCCAVPDRLHVNILHQLVDIKAPKCVICEKPLATKLFEAVEISDKYHRNQVPVIVNYTRRFINGFFQIKKSIEDMGKFILGNCYYGKGLIHNGSHMVNLLDYLLGFSEYEDITVFDIITDFFEGDPSYEFLMNLKRNAKIYFHVIPENITTVFQFDLFFESGRVSYDSILEKIEVYSIKDWEKYSGYTCYRKVGDIKTDRSEAMINLYKDVLETIRNGNSVRSSGDSAVNTLRICDSVIEKMKRV